MVVLEGIRTIGPTVAADSIQKEDATEMTIMLGTGMALVVVVAKERRSA